MRNYSSCKQLLISACILGGLQLPLLSQEYYTLGAFGIYEFDINGTTCSFNNVTGWGTPVVGGMTMTPDTDVVMLGRDVLGDSLYWVDFDVIQWVDSFALPTNIVGHFGLVSVGNGIFYTQGLDQDLYEIDIINNTVISQGPLPFWISDLCLFEGEIYFIYHTTNGQSALGLRRLDIGGADNSEIVAEFAHFDERFMGLSATNICNTLVGITAFTSEVYYINILDGSMTFVCDNIQAMITSMNEFETPTDCTIYLDLDEDDSSGAPDADYFGGQFTCQTEGVAITDEDITILFDALLAEMTIEITGFIPDDPNEILSMTASIPGIEVQGDNTKKITLINEGNASSEDFKEALRAIEYINTAASPTAGQRTIEVQFTTQSGAMSNIATGFIDVLALPQITVDLGDDLLLCENTEVTFNAGNPGATYEWSTNQSSQTITVDEANEYSVTVSLPGYCPGIDDVVLAYFPLIDISLTGDDALCEGQTATLHFEASEDIPLDFDVLLDPGTALHFDDVTGELTFEHVVTTSTGFTISNLTSSFPFCLQDVDSTHFIEAYETYAHAVTAVICEGGGIVVNGEVFNTAGVYPLLLTSMYGCDSTVTLTIVVVPPVADTTFIQSGDCNAVDTGTFIQHLVNIGGCDSIVVSEVAYLVTPTTLVEQWTCDSAQVGVVQQALLSHDGCDSIVVTTTSLLPPDTTYTSVITCIPSEQGVFEFMFQNALGCDSLEIRTVSLSPADTTHVSGTTCDPAGVGVTEMLFQNVQGCDSVIITAVSLLTTDTTNLGSTSCDSASIGVFMSLLQNQHGCDSLVITTISYSAVDSVYFHDTSCDSTDTGIIEEHFVNHFGCDSIVFNVTSFSPGNVITFTNASCHVADTGTFVQVYSNQAGCDSTVINIITFIAAQQTFLFGTTCIASEAGVFDAVYPDQTGCDSVVTTTIALVHSDTTNITAYTCDPVAVGEVEHHFTAMTDCDSLVVEHTLLYTLPELSIDATTDFNGYGISCAGAADGMATAEVTGIGPFTYTWSTGGVDSLISSLPAGIYTLTVTDANGCSAVEAVLMNAPEPLSFTLAVSQPDCFDHEAGIINVIPSGGVEPLLYSLNEMPFSLSSVFDELAGGTYSVTAMDANGCEAKEIAWINVPLMVNVEVGDDEEIIVGDTVTITAIVNVPYDSLMTVTWSGLLNPACPTCLSQPVAPIITTTYAVVVISHDGCRDEDAITLYLSDEPAIYIPNVFTPNGDGINDLIGISTSDEVEAINAFYIYDRWGNLVFVRKNLMPDDPQLQWDGMFHDEPMDPAVFAYKAIIRLSNGSEVIRYGDITLIR